MHQLTIHALLKNNVIIPWSTWYNLVSSQTDNFFKEVIRRFFNVFLKYTVRKCLEFNELATYSMYQ